MSDGPAFTELLTLPQLVAAVPRLLAGRYAGSTSGRIRGLPDLRTVRWYRTLGLVDAAGCHRGRTALYGRRQLLQLVAIKQLQAGNLPLADIQAGLAGRSDRELATVAGVSVDAADKTIRELVAGEWTTPSGRLPALSPNSPDRPANTARRDLDFWAVPAAADRPIEQSKLAEGGPHSSLAAEPAKLQSLPLADDCLLIWRGPAPDVAAAATLKQLAAPLLEFLASNDHWAAAEAPMKSSPAPTRPTAGGGR